MAYFVTLKHGEVEEHRYAADAVRDLAECMDNPPGHGAEMWWEPDPAPLLEPTAEQVRECVERYEDAHDAQVETFGACPWCHGKEPSWRTA